MPLARRESRLIEPLAPSKVVLAIIIKEWLHMNQAHPSTRITFNKMLLQMLQQGENESFKHFFSGYSLQNNAQPRFKWMVEIESRVKSVIKSIINQGVAALVDFHSNLSEVVYGQEAAVTATSITGFFLRRVCVQFEILSFADLAVLQRRMKSFAQTHLLQDGELSSQPEVSKIEELATRTFTKNEAELYITQQVQLLQSASAYAEPASLISSNLSSIIALHGDTLPSSHFLQFLNFMRQNNSHEAEICLKRAFGTTDNFLLDNPNYEEGNDNGGNKEQSSLSLRTKNLRYSLLMLSKLHSLFDDTESALAALHEAIRMSRDAVDEICLQYSLAWLLELQKEGDDNRIALLKTLLTKSVSLTQSDLAFHALKVGIYTKTTRGGELPSLLQQLYQSASASLRSPQLRVDHCSLVSFVFGWHGFTAMSTMHSQMALITNFGRGNCNEAHVLAMCNVASSLFAAGEFKPCRSIFDLAKKLFPSPSSSLGRLWRQCELMLTFKHKLYVNDWPKAEAVLMELEPFNSFEATLMSAELDLWQGNGDSLAKKIEHLKGMIVKKGTKEDELRVIWLEIEWLCLLRKFNHGERVSKMAVKISSVFRLFHFEAVSQLYLIHIQMHLGLIDTKLLRTLESALTKILVSGNAFEEGRARLLLAKAMVVHSKEKSNVLLAINQLRLAIDVFKRTQANCRVKDSLYLLARLYEHLGIEEERNLASSEFRKLDEETPMYAMPALPYML